MAWELDSKRSIYLQLIDRIIRRIVSGYYPPGSRIASVRELADEAGVNPNTMQRALSSLEESGVLYAQRTAGRFITEDTEKIESLRKDMALQAAREFTASVKELGYTSAEIASLLHEIENKEG